MADLKPEVLAATDDANEIIIRLKALEEAIHQMKSFLDSVENSPEDINIDIKRWGNIWISYRNIISIIILIKTSASYTKERTNC